MRNHLLAGTHDNETAAGWWADSANEKDRNYITSYLQFDGQDIAGAFTRAAYSSVAKTAIIMIQASRAAYNQNTQSQEAMPRRNTDSGVRGLQIQWLKLARPCICQVLTSGMAC